MSDFSYNLQSLLNSLDEIKKASYGETTVQVFGKNFVLGLLTAEEQGKVHEYCSNFKNQITYALNYQLETLAYAIKGLNNEHFGHVLAFPTGRYNEDGKEITEQKNIFWRRTISGWNSKIRDRLFAEYTKFDAKFNETLDDSLEFAEPPKQEVPNYNNVPEPKRKMEKVDEDAARRAAYADSSFNIPEDIDQLPLYDSKGNLTVEGKAIQDYYKKLEEAEQKAQQEQEEYFDEEPEREEDLEQEEDSPLSDEEIRAKLQGLLPKGVNLQKAQLPAEDMARLTRQMEKSQTEEGEEENDRTERADSIEEQPQVLTSQQISKAFHKGKKPPTPTFQKHQPPPKNKAEQIRQERERQEFKAAQRERDFDDENIQLTSSSRPLDGIPPGIDKKRKGK